MISMLRSLPRHRQRVRPRQDRGDRCGAGRRGPLAWPFRPARGDQHGRGRGSRGHLGARPAGGGLRLRCSMPPPRESAWRSNASTSRLPSRVQAQAGGNAPPGTASSLVPASLAPTPTRTLGGACPRGWAGADTSPRSPLSKLAPRPPGVVGLSLSPVSALPISSVSAGRGRSWRRPARSVSLKLSPSCPSCPAGQWARQGTASLTSL